MPKLQEKNDKLIEDIRNLFGEMDKRGTGKLTYDEYMEAVEANDVIKTKFVTLEIEHAEELWNLIDVGTGEIAVNQFAQGLRIISEETKAKDLFAINRRVGNAAHRLEMCVPDIRGHVFFFKILFRAEVRTHMFELHKYILYTCMVQLIYIKLYI